MIDEPVSGELEANHRFAKARVADDGDRESQSMKPMECFFGLGIGAVRTEAFQYPSSA
jgi:hypothetical protein